MTSLWLLEDNKEFASNFSDYLGTYGFAVRIFSRVEPLITELDASSPKPDVMVIDRWVHGSDMLTYLTDIRQKYNGGCVILTGAENEPVDRVVGLELGSDQFLSKLLPPREILANLRAVLRRATSIPTAGQAPIRDGGTGWHVDGTKLAVIRPDGFAITFTSSQFRLLSVLIERTGQLVTRDEISTRLFGREADPLRRNIDVLVSQVRRKLLENSNRQCDINSLRGQGYIFAGFPHAL